jgi:hypothetical protein
MNEIYFHRDDLERILKFFNDFPERETILVSADSSSGIGTMMKASIIGATVNGHIVTVTKEIVDETSW